jgi:hypothetical protein
MLQAAPRKGQEKAPRSTGKAVPSEAKHFPEKLAGFSIKKMRQNESQTKKCAGWRGVHPAR